MCISGDWLNKLYYLQIMRYCAAITRNEEYLYIPLGNDYQDIALSETSKLLFVFYHLIEGEVKN